MNLSELDPKFVSAIAGFAPRAIAAAKKVFGSADQSLDYAVKKAHTNYACAIISKYSRAKTFLIRSEPEYLYEFYVPASVERRGTERIERVDITKLKAISQRVIITGSGGSGKTILLKHLLLDTLVSGTCFPVLVELRNLNENQDRTLDSEILETLRDNEFDLDEKYIKKSFSEGLFVLLLDGFDEVQFSRRKSLEREIKRFSITNDCQIIITSRADASLQSWERFTNVSISDLTLDEACDLVSKIKFDKDIKARFSASLKSGLFESHKFFLSNPLLLSIMLLTYGDSADIPKRQSSFYMQAYEALFQQHDALKSSFKRDRNTDLDIYEFSRLFSAFSMVSYEERAFSFSRTSALKYAKKAVEITGLGRVNPDGFIDDAKQAVCLLMEEGLELAYAHRSFQEFFAARFISESEESWQKVLIQRITDRKHSALVRDNVIGLLHEMSPLAVEKFFLIPKLTFHFGDQSKRRLSRKFCFDMFCRSFEAARVDKGDKRVWLHVSEKNQELQELISFVSSRYLKYRFDKAADERWRQRSRVFTEKYFDGKPFILKLRDLKYEPGMANDLLDLHEVYSPSGLEQVRLVLRDMRLRAKTRTTALEKIFAA